MSAPVTVTAPAHPWLRSEARCCAFCGRFHVRNSPYCGQCDGPSAADREFRRQLAASRERIDQMLPPMDARRGDDTGGCALLEVANA